MKDRKIDKVEEDIYNVIDDVLCRYYGKEVDEIESNLKEKFHLLLWEYEMQNFLGD